MSGTVLRLRRLLGPLRSRDRARPAPAPWVRTRLLSSPGANSALALLLVVTAFLAAALPLTLDRDDDRALHARIGALPTLSRGIDASATPQLIIDQDGNPQPRAMADEVSGALLGEVDRTIRQQIGAPLRIDAANAVYGVRTTAPAPTAGLPRLYPTVSSVADLAWQPDLAKRARLSAGRWPRSAGVAGPTDQPTGLEAVVSTATARSLQLRVGSLIHPAVPGTGPIDIRVVGLFTPIDPGTGYWADTPRLGAAGVDWTVATSDEESHPYWHITAMLADGDAAALPQPALGLYWHLPVDRTDLHAFQIGGALGVLASLTAGPRNQVVQDTALADGLPGGIRIGTQLVTVLTAAEQDQRAVAPMLAVGTAGAAGTALTLLLMSAVLATERRAEELRLLRARGMSLGGMTQRLLGESTAVALPATALGIAAALLLLPGPRPGYAVAAGLVVPLVAVLAFPVRALAAHRRAVERGGRPEGARRRGGRGRTVVELGVFAFAAAAAVGLRVRGTGAAASGVDPLISAAPLLLALAAALLVVRLYPLPLGLLGRIFGRGRGALVFLGTARAGRSAAGVAVMPLLALLLALSTAAFGATVVEGVDSGRARAALLQVGADTRFDGTPQLPPGFAAAITRVPGVRRAVPVRELSPGTGDAGGGGTQTAPFVLVGVDPASYAALSRELGNGGFDPRLLAGPGADGHGPAPALLSAGLAASLDAGSASYPMNGGTLSLRVAGTLRSTPAVPTGQDFAVIPEQAELAQLSPYMTPVQLADNVVLSIDRAAPAALRRAAVRATPAGFYTPVAVTVRQEVLHRLSTTPTQRAATRLYLEASAAALLFSLLAVMLSLVQAGPGRAALLSRLRTMGLAPRQGYLLTLTESLPQVALAALGGALLSLGLVPLLGPALDLGALIGAPAPDPLAPNTAALVLPSVGLLALATIVVLMETAVVARRHIATELRAGDRQ